MSTLKKILLSLLATALLIGGVTAFVDKGDKPLRPVPQDPSTEPVELLLAQPFELDEPFVHTWRAEQPLVSTGYILVIHADPDLVRPRQSAEAILYVGAQTAERCNAGAQTGNLVVVVPVEPDADGVLALDLASTPIWFGTAGLPEQVDETVIQGELAAARANVGNVSATIADEALARGGGTVYALDRGELDFRIADLIETYSPDEVDRVAGMRVPLTRR